MKLRIVACLWLALASAAAAALTPEELFEQRSKSIFVVHVYDKQGKRMSQGSAVVIGPEQVITNCHVLAKGSGIRISRGNMSFIATLEFPDAERDLCQLKVKDLVAPAAPMADVATVKIGQRVYAIGAPQRLELTLTDGLVSSLREMDEGEPPVIQTSAPASPGSSGGGLFDARGNLIGIVTFGFRGEQLNFALPVDWVRQVPERGRALLAKRRAAAEARAAAPTSAGTAVAALAPIDPSLPKEMPQAGDTWTYVVLDLLYKPGDRSRKFVHTVKNVTRGAIIEARTAPNALPVEVDFTSDTSAIYRAQGEVLEVAPFITGFRKLQPGEQWGAVKIRGLEVMPLQATTGEIPYFFEAARVSGQERVTVAAGTFDAIRVELDGKISNILAGGSAVIRGYSPFKQTVWYAPQVKRFIKLVASGPNFSTAYELETYSLR